MFESLGEKFDSLLRKLQGQGRITERNIEEALRDVRLALLEADVNVAVVREFVDAVKRAIEEPLRWIANNAGAEGSIVLDKVKNGKGSFGFDAAKEEYGDLIKAGIIDPTKVVRTALLNAASVAGLLLTTEAMVAEKPEEKPAAPGMPPGGMGGMGGMM